MMLVAGFSGIGKTAVINEIHKPIVRQRGYFIKGKFDQFNRNIPFSGFVQAFRDLMRQLLSESDTQLDNWKQKIINAVGENGQVLIEVIPELENIIGQQPPVPELSGSAAQNRFNLLFGKFISVFTTKDHPLVIFLDDLQWADLASLKLLKLLMSESEIGYLLVLGAYRDNEVFPTHPLMLTLDEIQKQEVKINTITLAALREVDITRLVADTLQCSVENATPLSELVYQKTKGNPFFTTQFLKGLHEDAWIIFDSEAGYWQCDLTQIRQLSLTDDVLEFMVGRLRKLESATQNVLKLAACIGNQFDLETLAVICEKTLEKVATDLWGSLQEGFVIPQSETYKFFQGEEEKDVEDVTVGYRFLHDRVQQAAYSLIPEKEKQITHYHIGQLLLQQLPKEAREDRIFELVGQLNYGTVLISEQKERDELSKLNLIACRKARAATAYQAGREYASIGLSLLGKKPWQHQYEMCLEFHNLTAELASLCGEFDVMEQFIDTVIEQANYLLEKVNVYLIRIRANVFQNKSNEAIAIAQQLLQQFDVTFPQTPTQNDIQDCIAEINRAIGDREIEDLVDLQIMTDVEKIAIIQIANSITPAAYISGSPLFPLLISLSVKLSIQYGNTTASVLAYSTYGIVACNFLQDVDMGVKFGQLAIQVVSKLDAKAVKPEVLAVAGIFILHRKYHIKEVLPLLQDGYATGLEVGSLEFLGYCAHGFCLNSFWCGQSLAILEPETRAYSHALVQLNQLITGNWCLIYWQSILNLLEAVEDPTTLSGEALQEAELLPQLLEANDSNGLYYFYVYKLMLCYLFGEIESAQNYAVEGRRYLMGGAGSVTEPAFYFYDSLVALAQMSSPAEETSAEFQRVEQNQTQLQQQWANYAPMNHQHKVDLVEAEKCRVLGQKAEAVELYARAIAGAKENEYIQEEALANELVAKFYLDWCQEKAAVGYMQEAYYCYARWGARAKTKQLESTYPQLLTAILERKEPHNFHNTVTSTQSSDTLTIVLDQASVIKASRAISEEIELNSLLSKLMRVLMENAGANKGVLLLSNSDNWEIVAQSHNNTCDLSTIPLEQTDIIPLTIINTVKRTQKTLLLNNLEQNNTFITDPYFFAQKPKSLLCTPILHQGKLIGILYLENNLTTEAFTPERLEILNLLTAQAAISIENARLYQHLEAKVEQRTQHLQETLKQLQQTQAQLIQTEKMSSLGQMVAGIAHEINNPISFISGNITHAREYFQDLLELLNLYQEDSPHPSSAIQDKVEELDLEFLCDDLEKLLNSMETGSKRISKIIRGLRNFSRLDESKSKEVDIHEGLENTLMILQHRLNGNSSGLEIAIVKNYGELPRVNCYANQLNQVFLYILNNALDAVIASETDNCPQISITTEMKDSQTVTISIADNGIGMSEDICQRIFEPFFTTKPVGKGTGLGLFISYQIITEQHGGKLECISQTGKGTEFMIDIPIK
ncbi:MAG: AAA family ATPase [Okeania sp. SIO3H1]|nr:AAA family ATPase [Okeania sp. SIO3H1]